MVLRFVSLPLLEEDDGDDLLRNGWLGRLISAGRDVCMSNGDG